MNRREFYGFVQGLARDHSAREVLEAVTEGMQSVRKVPAKLSLLAKQLLQSELRSILGSDDALGQVYQALNAPALEKAYRGTAREGRKFHEHEIPAVTQLFTPRWVVEYLLQNSLGKLWLEMHPDSRLAGKMQWYVHSVLNPQSSVQRLVREIRVLDPACGTMNFGLVAVELLEAMYHEEWSRAGEKGWPEEPSVTCPEEIPAAIARHNLFGIDIDPIALELARQTLGMKIGQAPIHLVQADALLDPEIETQLGLFDVVVTNPPYLSARNLSADVVRRLKKKYPAGSRDLYACFIERSLQLLREGGRAGLLTMHSFMFTGGYEKLRKRISETAAVETLAHFGAGLFDIGNPGTLQTVAFVLRRQNDAVIRASQPLAGFRVVEPLAARGKKAELARQIHSCDLRPMAQRDLCELPRGTWAYWASPRLRRCFKTLPKLAAIAPPRQGLATTDNARFVRYWWEIQKPKSANQNIKWFPYAKGGGFRRWYKAPEFVVNWENDGEEIKKNIAERYPYLQGDWRWVAKNSSHYGKSGITWSYLTSGAFSARLLPAGSIFDVAGSSLFPENIAWLLAVLNSSVARELLEIINPTINFQVGDLSELPIATYVNKEIAAHVDRAVQIQKQLDSYDETTVDFAVPPAWENAREIFSELRKELMRLEQELDCLVGDVYKVLIQPIPVDDDGGLDQSDLAKRWINHALRLYLRQAAGPVMLQGKCGRGVSEMLAGLVGDTAARQIEQMVGGMGKFLQKGFFPWHVKLYRQRPVIWHLHIAEKDWLVPHEQADAKSLAPLLRSGGESLPSGWDRYIDDGIAVNLAPLGRWIADKKYQRLLKNIMDDLLAGRYGWARTSSGWSS